MNWRHTNKTWNWINYNNNGFLGPDLVLIRSILSYAAYRQTMMKTSSIAPPSRWHHHVLAVVQQRNLKWKEPLLLLHWRLHWTDCKRIVGVLRLILFWMFTVSITSAVHKRGWCFWKCCRVSPCRVWLPVLSLYELSCSGPTGSNTKHTCFRHTNCLEANFHLFLKIPKQTCSSFSCICQCVISPPARNTELPLHWQTVWE